MKINYQMSKNNNNNIHSLKWFGWHLTPILLIFNWKLDFLILLIPSDKSWSKIYLINSQVGVSLKLFNDFEFQNKMNEFLDKFCSLIETILCFPSLLFQITLFISDSSAISSLIYGHLLGGDSPFLEESL